MFLVIGMISILFGVFVFNQTWGLLVLSNITQQQAELTKVLLDVRIIQPVLAILGGIFSCSCRNGESWDLVVSAMFVHAVSFLMGILSQGYLDGYLADWSLIAAIILVVWLFRNRPKKQSRL